MTTVILGAGGQLGNDLVGVLSDKQLVPLAREDLDIRDFAAVRKILEDIRPKTVINTAAYVQVDKCEQEQETAFAVNAFAARNLARVCADLDCLCVQISTSYVFDGRKRSPYTERDLPGPLNVYGMSKLVGEHFVSALCPKHVIVRTSGLYGVKSTRSKGNFVETMIQLASESRPIRVVDDQFITPTHTGDLAGKIRGILETDGRGVFHVTNSGRCSWFEFADYIFRMAGLSPDLKAIASEEYETPAKRPANAVLANSALRRLGLDPMPHWKRALRRYLNEKGFVAR